MSKKSEKIIDLKPDKDGVFVPSGEVVIQPKEPRQRQQSRQRKPAVVPVPQQFRNQRSAEADQFIQGVRAVAEIFNFAKKLMR